MSLTAGTGPACANGSVASVMRVRKTNGSEDMVLARAAIVNSQADGMREPLL